ncbi:MAG: DUF4082 domain-containing protein [Chloroflexi bacterium]|nr:DUF4082 domain-containing protein [Chloroflexota bacterium]
MHPHQPLTNRRSHHPLVRNRSAGYERPGAAPSRSAGVPGHAPWVILALLSLLLSLPGLTPPLARAAGPCDPPVANPIVCENSKPGNPSTEWDVSGAGDPSIQGFATDISVNKGETVFFKVKTTAAAYRADIYRMGYYGGMGARKVATIQPSAPLPQTQPACLTDTTTGLIDCGNWGVSASWAVPADAVSGIYFARLVRSDTGGASHIMFIVRDDASSSPVLFQTSDTTWQAYNDYGGNSLYVGSPAGRAYKVSYNRPFNTRAQVGGLGTSNWVFYGEYPMVRWLEANGYNLSYFTGVDSDRRGALIKNHRVFLSVGHDEYWSAGQRANLEAAREAGVNLAFFSGNEIFWKTRWEPSIDGSNTAYRTLVTYKETKVDAPLDPNDPPTWTGSWRDPRFSPPADGGRPENGLSGTIFMVNRGTAAITVPAAYGKARLWRNTSVATLSAGQTATLASETLGYEWDEDLDNGARPAGVVQLSSTTVSVPELLQDYGNTYSPGTAIHHLTLYRAASGALVFGAGTVQWSWGLDVNHDIGPDTGSTTPDPRMQQATVNLLADMGVQPGTLQPGLVAATASADATAPTSTITSPASGATVQVGSAVTISGTAADAGGGVVGGVEVSVNGGATWHPATGRESWSYTWTPSFGGSVTLQSRAVDDSANLERPGAGVTVTVQGDTTPPVISNVQTTAITNTGATITWSTNEPADSQVEYGTSTAYGSSTPLDSTLATSHSVPLTGLATNTQYHYRVRSKDAVGNLALSPDFIFTSGVVPLVGDQGIETILDGNAAGLAEAFQYLAGASGTATKIQVYVDATNTATQVVVGLYTNNPSTNSPGSLLTQGTITNPVNGAWNSVAVPAASVTGGTQYWIALLSPAGTGKVQFRDVSSGGRAQTSSQSNLTALPATWTPGVTYSNSPMSAYVSGDAGSDAQPPSVALASPASGATVSGTAVTVAADATDNVGVASVQFLLDGAPLGSPVATAPYSTTWNTTTTTNGAHTLSAEARDGAGNIGTAAPVAVTVANNDTTPPVISAVAASNVSATGATITWTTDEPATSQVEYGTTTAYGSSTTRDPTLATSHSQTLANLAAGTAYHYRVISQDGAGNVATSADFAFTTAAADTTPPAISNVQATAITRTGATITWTTDEPADSQVEYGTSTAYGASTPLDSSLATSHSAPLAGLTLNTVYHYRVKSKDAAGNLATSGDFTFTTQGCPCSIWDNTATPAVASANDTNTVELGVKFRAETDGYITGVRFYKGSANTGTHLGNLWTGTGTLLASATFASETASGWQQVSFATPVKVTANTTYVASYHTNTGGYAFTGFYFATAGVDSPPLHALANGVDGGNGVFAYGASSFPTQSFNSANYWVDVVFSATTADGTPPTITSQSPAPNAAKVPLGTTVAATFSESVTPTSIKFELRDPSNAIVPASVAYDDPTRTATLTPTASLKESTTYTATLSGAADLAGNVMAPVTWSFTTLACPCSIWSTKVTPTVASANDPSAVELGVKFRTEVDGYVTGVRFYKGSANTGPHTGSLWTSTGTLLGSVTFSGETASGWQQVSFATPLKITANTTYVASYHTDSGNYAVDQGYFGTGVDNAPLLALANGVDGGNGVFAYGSSGFPNQSFNASNYWVDVVFSTIAADTIPPTVTSHTPATNATGVSPLASVTATFSEPVASASISFTLRDPGNAVVPAAVTYDSATQTATLKPSSPLALSATYTATVSGATDLAGNVMAAPATWSFSTPTCPCSLWSNAATPAVASANDPNAAELGVKFRTEVDGYITGLRFYKGSANTGTHLGNLWTSTGTLLGSATFSNETASGWQQVDFAAPVPVSANTIYVASYHTDAGGYAVNQGYFGAGVDNTPLHAPADGVAGGNGVFNYGPSGFPSQSFNASNYWVDVVFSTTPPTTPTPTPTPTVLPSATPTATPTAMVGPTITDVASPTPTTAPSPTPTALLSPTPTALPSPTPTAAPSPTPTAAPSATPTALPSPTPTAAPSPTPTAVPSPTSTAAPSATPTAAPSSTPTAVPSPTPTAAPSATPTAVPSPTPSPMPTATASPTALPSPTATAAASPTVSASSTPTATPKPKPRK